MADNTYYKTEATKYLSSSSIDQAIDRALQYLDEHYGIVALVSTSMVIQRDLLFVTVIAKGQGMPPLPAAPLQQPEQAPLQQAQGAQQQPNQPPEAKA